MLIVPPRPDLITGVERLMRLGGPYVVVRGVSDSWLYATLFASTCPVAVEDGEVVGAVIAIRRQDDRDDVYVQDVVIHRAYRGVGWRRCCSAPWSIGCDGGVGAPVYFTCAPANAAAATWWRLGFRNLPGDRTVADIQVLADVRGPGRDCAVYELDVTTAIKGDGR